jgi:5-formyltetrahydrofolate cyclo-ligase
VTGPTGKAALRRELLRRRLARPAAEVDSGALPLTDHVLAVLDAPLRRGPRSGSGPPTVAAYAALGSEPPTGPLLAALAARGVPVLLPVLRPDGDLDWALAGLGELVAGRAGTRQPPGPLLGPDAVTSVGALVVPGLAGDSAGRRLGRGGGSYDRALTRVPRDVPVLLLLYDDEVVDHVPVEPHDRHVTHLVTPRRVLVAQPPGGGLD